MFLRKKSFILATAFLLAMAVGLGSISTGAQDNSEPAPTLKQRPQPPASETQGAGGQMSQGQMGQQGQAQGQAQGQGDQTQSGPGRGPSVDPAEAAAIQAFNTAQGVDAKIAAGESFDQNFPNSRYQEAVDSMLVTLYYQKSDWPKFYAASEKELARDPDNVPILTLVGWVIPRSYNADDPSQPAKLDLSEKYETHALELIPQMKKPPQLTDEQFNQAKASAAAEAHSGLGMTYYRRNNFAESAKELDAAVSETTNPDPPDLYILGIDLKNLKRNSEAADAFAKCAAIPGEMQARCKAASTAQPAGQTPPGR